MPAPPSNSLPTQRINYLDSVRGLAALAVVFYHFFGWKWDRFPDKLLQYNLTSLVFNGSDAVSLFFVLSGLVLSWKYFYPNQALVIDGPHYREYVLNRVVRLYLPFLAALLLVYYYSIHHHGDNLTLLSEFVTNKFGWMEEALLIRGKHDLYTPGWTLEVEMVGSLLLPFLVLLLRYNRQLFGTLLAVFLVIGGSFVMGTLGHFMLGMVLTYYFPRIAGYNLRQSKLYPFRFLLYLLIFVTSPACSRWASWKTTGWACCVSICSISLASARLAFWPTSSIARASNAFWLLSRCCFSAAFRIRCIWCIGTL